MEGPRAREARQKLEVLRQERKKATSLRVLTALLLVGAPVAVVGGPLLDAMEVLPDDSGPLGILWGLVMMALPGAFLMEYISDNYDSDLKAKHKIENLEADYFDRLERGV